MAHMIVKWSEEGKGTEKWRKILMIAEGKMSLSRDAESLYFVLSEIKNLFCLLVFSTQCGYVSCLVF